MAKTILLEGRNLTRLAGTGIATYSRVLTHIARELGYDVDALISVDKLLDRGNRMLSEIDVYDAMRVRQRTRAHRAWLEMRYLIGLPRGVRPVALPTVDSPIAATASVLADFKRVHAASNLFYSARHHFKRYGRMAVVNLSGPVPALFHAAHPTPLTVKGCPNIQTIHDLVPLRLPHTTPDEKKYHLEMVREVCRTADHIVTVSEFSRNDVIDFMKLSPDRITNTYQAVVIPEAIVSRPEGEVSDELASAHGVGFQEYFLFVGAIEPKKNLGRLIEAYAASGSKRPLIVVGGLGWQYEADVARLNDERFLSWVIEGNTIRAHRRARHLHYVPYSTLMTLIRGARALLFPSLYEGFGLPVLEAMHLGTPTLTSNVSSLPEIVGDAAEMVNPYEVDAIAAGIRRLDRDDDLCRELAVRGRAQAAKFSRERYSERVKALYGRLA